MRKIFLVVLVAGTFVWFTGRGLPPVVASHFGPGGEANGHMDRSGYTLFALALALALVIAVPLLIASSTLLLHVLPPQLINLPNKQYWLAPERRTASMDALDALSVRFAAALAAFFCFVHWLVVQANSVQPPKLQESWFFVGLAVLGAVTLGSGVSLYRRFGRVP